MPAQDIIGENPLANGIAPVWADRWAQDKYGPFIEVDIAGVMQRLRWIPPGRFRMGSPDDEPGRRDNEGPQHRVHIRRGFWLFDTPVTQESWEAVMGQNRSDFESPQRPVETVSWDDCQEFCERVAELKGEFQLGLPTEAEWEYACRAGTTTATYNGPLEMISADNTPVLDAIAWYGGNCGVEWELAEGNSVDWDDKQYEFDTGGTRVVATREPNAWGLYDMLGNVWEWCLDHGQRLYTDDEATDPYYEQRSASAYRVMRGGTWISSARTARAAYRGAASPGLRGDLVGFRCRVR